MAKRVEWRPAGWQQGDAVIVLHDETRLPTRVLRGIKGLDAPSFEFASYVSAGVDGVRLGSATASRELTVPVFIQARSRVELRRRKAEVIAGFDPKRGAGCLVVSEEVGFDSGTVRYVSAVYRGGLQGDGSQGGLEDWWRFDLSLECTDPYWYSIDKLRATWAGKAATNFFPFAFPLTLSDSGVDVHEALDVTGDADTWPSFDMYGPFTKIRARLEDDARPAFWEIQRATSETEMLRLSTKPGDESLRLLTTTDGVSWSDAGNIWSALHPNSWFEPIRFRDQLIWNVDGTSATTRIELSADEAWYTSS